MAVIKPISDLRDYNKVLKECKNGEPVFLTKNGHGIFVVVDIQEYERLKNALTDKTNNKSKHSMQDLNVLFESL